MPFDGEMRRGFMGLDDMLLSIWSSSRSYKSQVCHRLPF
jgi:hypothetical protein